MGTLRKIAKSVLPPVISQALVKALTHQAWSGDYASWKEASEQCVGYDDLSIVDKMMSSTQKVVSGEYAYERDSVLFSEPEINFPVVSSLLFAAQSTGKLSVVDFGGAFGSTYFQNRTALGAIPHLDWRIVELESYRSKGQVLEGKFPIRFYSDIHAAVNNPAEQVLLISSSLQYLQEPYAFLEKAVEYGFGSILIDRLALNSQDRDRLTCQNVPESIYKASYPCWFLDEARVLKILQKKYQLRWSFAALDVANIPSRFKGYFFTQ
jgi:putative methyltransferase (TIGR04325 family)